MRWARIRDGEKFGRLTVKGVVKTLVRKNGKTGERLLSCLCECGRLVNVRASNLKSGNTLSCGCLHSERTRDSNEKRALT